MGVTLSDRHRTMYEEWRNEGMNHEEALSEFPDHIKKRVERELNMTFIESHYGMKDKYFFIILGVVIIGTIIFWVIYLANFFLIT